MGKVKKSANKLVKASNKAKEMQLLPQKNLIKGSEQKSKNRSKLKIDKKTGLADSERRSDNIFQALLLWGSKYYPLWDLGNPLIY